MQPYNHQEVEKRIYQMWEEGGYFTPKIDPTKKTFVIILAPPNASGAMHLGNVFSLVLQDVLIRYHRMQGEPTLFLPGIDHGGYETQITYEQELKRQGKSSADLTRRELYNNISLYVQKNNELIKQQLKALGASVDWSRFHFTLEEQAIQSTYATFKKLRQDGLIKRDKYWMAYCPECKTTLQNIEVEDGVCKAGHAMKETPVPNWRVQVDAPHKSLKKPTVDAVQTGQITILPLSRENALKYVESLEDWHIARQNVWGIRIPGWYEITHSSLFTVGFIDKNGGKQDGNLKDLLEKGFSWEEIEKGLERVEAHEDAIYVLEEGEKKDGVRYLPETDTFDTWFSSTEWVITTLKETDTDFNYFYPASIEVVGRDLLQKAVAREIMLAYYLTGQRPYSSVYLHRLILGSDGKKMSKSLGNAVYPERYIEKFGADALRMALISCTWKNENYPFPREDIVAKYQQMSRRIWDLGQHIDQMVKNVKRGVPWYSHKLSNRLRDEDKEVLSKLKEIVISVSECLDTFQYAHAQHMIKRFIFEWLENKYVEQVKRRYDQDLAVSVLRYAYLTSVILLHPFMPFITEEISRILTNGKKRPLIVTSWPRAEEL